MLKPPKVGGAEQLRLFVHQLGFDRCVKILDIHPSTLRGWLRGARPAPQAALQALYWLTDWGYSVACSEAHWSHQFMLYKVRELEARLAALRSGRPMRDVPVLAGRNDPLVTAGDRYLHHPRQMEIGHVVGRETVSLSQLAQ